MVGNKDKKIGYISRLLEVKYDQRVKEGEKQRDSYRSRTKNALKEGKITVANQLAGEIAFVNRNIDIASKKRDAYGNAAIYAGFKSLQKDGKNSSDEKSVLKYIGKESHKQNASEAEALGKLEDQMYELNKATEATFLASNELMGNQYVSDSASDIIQQLQAEIDTEKSENIRVNEKMAAAQNV